MYWKAERKMLVNGEWKDIFICDVCHGLHFSEDEAKACQSLKPKVGKGKW